MTRDDLTRYLDSLTERYPLPFFIERYFRTDEEWERVAGSDFRNVRLSSRTNATLDQVIARRAAIVLGEPGSGKSTIAKAAIGRMINEDLVPIVAELRSYHDDLSALLATNTPADLLDGADVDGRSVERTLILDGVDEIPYSLVERFVDDFERTLESNAYRHILLTSRQAFFAAKRRHFHSPPDSFYVLGFSERDVRTFFEHRGRDFDSFMDEVRRLGLHSEITNAFSLEVLFKTFTEVGALSSLRHEAVAHVVESLIASRPRVAADRQRRALRMLAVAMETASRNELIFDEAVQVLQASTPATDQEANELLDELTHSILVQTPNGISFQMRSYGEYLAAVELRGMTLDRVQLLVHHEHTGIPNDSWRNCVSYLAELHEGVRRSFALQNPDWVLAASPHSFTENERTSVITRLLDRLSERGHYIRRHPFLNADAVARFVTDDVRNRLMADVTNPDPPRAGNAMAILGACGMSAVVEGALSIALTRDCPQLLRESAIGAVAAAGDSSLIPRLMESLAPNDQLHLSLVDCIGALTDAATIPIVLPLLMDTDALVSSAFHRFHELRSREAAEAFLEFLVARPLAVSSTRLGNYSDPMWDTMADLWDPRWAEAVADLLVAWEHKHVMEFDVQEAIEALRALPDGGAQVAQIVLAKFLALGEAPFYFAQVVAGLVTPAVAEWLTQQHNSRSLMEVLARFGTPAVRRTVAPHVDGLVERQDEAAAGVQADNEAREEQERRRIAEQQDVVSTGGNFDTVLLVLSRLNAKDWPELNAQRGVWLAQQCEDWLMQIDPIRSVRWHTENRLSYNEALPWLLRVIDHYGLRVENDVLLVDSLVACESGPVAEHHRRYGLSQPALEELERILADPTTATGALSNLLAFLGDVEISTTALGTALVSIADREGHPIHIRSWAIRLACSKGVPDDLLAALGSRLEGELNRAVEQGLLERQHRPTIERRIAAVLADDNAMQAGEAPFPHESDLVWIGHITSDVFWPRLVELRAQALRLELPNMAGLITGVMAKMNGVELAKVVREQIAVTPVAWQDVQELRATEYERDARLRQAQTTPFERIIQRLRRATTLSMFKIWCEGHTDGPTIDQFLAKLPGASELGIVTDSLGGWDRILSRSWPPDRLRDGCHDLVVLLDGDKGRDFSVAGHPLSANALRVRQILEDVGVELLVLERYAIENYFSQQACEEVLGPNLAGCFPLPVDSSANLPRHNKNDNARIASAMTIDDLVGTDLLAILKYIATRGNV